MFCPACGTKVSDEALSCSQCGHQLGFKQNAARGSSGDGDGGNRSGASSAQTNLPGNVAAMLCYLFGWVTGIIFLLVYKEERFIRYHAWQSILTFGGITAIFILLDILEVLAPFGFRGMFFLFGAIHSILGLALFILWLILMVKAYQGRSFKLPLTGELAERYAGA